METKNKGKLQSASTPIPNQNSVLQLLPETILTLLVVLCTKELETIEYLMTRAGKSDEPSARDTKYYFVHHKAPIFDCDCFQCYAYFWQIWDSSPNHVLIHNAVEAYEEHLNNGEFSADALKRDSGGKNKKKEKSLKKDSGGKNKKKEKISRPKIANENEKINAVDGIVPEVEVVATENGGGEVVPPVALCHKFKCLSGKVLPNFSGLFNTTCFWSP